MDLGIDFLSISVQRLNSDLDSDDLDFWGIKEGLGQWRKSGYIFSTN